MFKSTTAANISRIIFVKKNFFVYKYFRNFLQKENVFFVDKKFEKKYNAIKLKRCGECFTDLKRFVMKKEPMMRWRVLHRFRVLFSCIKFFTVGDCKQLDCTKY